MDERARFEQVVIEHQNMVFGMLVRLTGSREHVDDLAQEVFLRLYRALPSFRGDALLTTYLHRIVVNVAQDEWKRRKKEQTRETSLSDDVSAWEDRLHHPSPTAEQDLQTRELQLRVEESMGEAQRHRTKRAGALPSGRAKLSADRREPAPADSAPSARTCTADDPSYGQHSNAPHDTREQEAHDDNTIRRTA